MLPKHGGFPHSLAQRALLWLPLCLDFAVGLRTREALGFSPEPSVVVVGMGHSGTAPVTKDLELMGMEYCHLRDNFEEPVWGHDHVKTLVRHFLNATRHDFSQASFAQDKAAFNFAVSWFRNLSAVEHRCIRQQRRIRGLPTDNSTRELKWGFKETHYSWLLPVMDAAFSNRTKYLMVARDPRDICTTDNRNQFSRFGQQAMNESDCLVWWGSFWHRLLNAYESEPRFAVLRIEDLVMPAPNVSTEPLKKMGCMARHVGMQVRWPRLETGESYLSHMGYAPSISTPLTPSPEGTERALESLEGQAASASTGASANVGGTVGGPQEAYAMFAEIDSWVFWAHRDSYFGHRANQSEAERQALVERTKRLEPWAKETMLRLGYDPTGFNLLTPKSRAVLCRDSA